MPFPPAPLIAAPEPGLVRYGLFRVAAGPLDMPAHGDGAGVRYVPPACGDSYAVGIDCPAPEELPAPDGDNPEIPTGVFSVRSAIECTLVGQTEADLRAKLLRRLEASEQAVVEATFATGLDYDGANLGVLSLDGAAEEALGPYATGDIRSVIGALLAESVGAYGFRPTVHAPASAEPYATDAGLVIADGQLLRTPTGAYWSFGNYPEGEMFISGAVTVWRSPVPAVTSVFDQATNRRTLVAERSYALGIDCGFARRATFSPVEV